MSNNLKVQVLLNAVDKASRPFKAVQTAAKNLSSDIRQTQTTIKELDAQAGKLMDSARPVRSWPSRSRASKTQNRR